MADFFVKRRGRLPRLEEAVIPGVNLAGILAYVIGSAAAYFSPGIPPVNGIIVGFVVYLVLDRILYGRKTGASESARL